MKQRIKRVARGSHRDDFFIRTGMLALCTTLGSAGLLRMGNV